MLLKSVGCCIHYLSANSQKQSQKARCDSLPVAAGFPLASWEVQGSRVPRDEAAVLKTASSILRKLGRGSKSERSWHLCLSQCVLRSSSLSYVPNLTNLTSLLSFSFLLNRMRRLNGIFKPRSSLCMRDGWTGCYFCGNNAYP